MRTRVQQQQQQRIAVKTAVPNHPEYNKKSARLVIAQSETRHKCLGHLNFLGLHLKKAAFYAIFSASVTSSEARL